MDDMSQLSDTVDDLKRKLDTEKNRSAVLEACLREQAQFSPVSCPDGYRLWRGICCMVFNTGKPFNEAAATCRKDGGTLAMPRDAETNAFLISLYTSIRADTSWFYIGLQDQRVEGIFEWADGSALGAYSLWGPGEPDGNGDCVVSCASGFRKGMWYNHFCSSSFRFICQATSEHVGIV
uniref:C-type lectin domain-containing protein n=1 Tax=Branchiostoma floridae TaxID=7739 RepID=C3Z3D7_BRAFL|eukprot:XP_002596969.1 hypothetical protein BRAFLDRAFT_76468 [Branchiostoma floridae]